MAGEPTPQRMLGLAVALALAVPFAGCAAHAPRNGQQPCADGGSRCAAASAPAGTRAVRRGHRIVRAHWLKRDNKESGQPDISIQAEWEAITERR